MNKRRLLKLADFLATVPRRALVMYTWTARPAFQPEGDAPGECGFAGCALGWAGHAKLFRDLKMDSRGIPFVEVGRRKASGFDAAMIVFGIDYGIASSLFGTACYNLASNPTPARVARRIRHLVATGEIK